MAGEPVFAAVLVEDGRVTLRLEKVPLLEVLRLADERGVDAIAVDNIFEIAGDFNSIASIFTRNLRKTIRLIEVTRIGEENVKLETLCALTGICKGKLSPLETAEIVGLLAYRGIGSEVLLFEEETRIHVGRGRVPGQGGMSRERYKRNIELLIKRKVAEIREQLQRANIDFDLFVRKSGIGLAGATFIVYAPREKLNGIVRQEFGHDFFVEIQPVKRESVGYKPLGRVERKRVASERYLIVGIDPGISTGVAVLDFSGNLLTVFSRRWLSRSQLLRMLFQFGRPTIVASDVNPAPSYVKKIAAQVGATLYTPPRSLSVEEKRRLVSESLNVENTHQRDALAAALKAFNEYRVKFEEVEKEALNFNVPIPLDYARYLVVKGTPVSHAVREAIREYLHLSSKEEQALHEASQQGSDELLKFYRRLVENLANENRALEIELRESKDKIASLESTLRSILGARTELRRQNADYSRLEAKIDYLNRELEELRFQLEESRRNMNVILEAFRKVALGKSKIALNLSLLLEASDGKDGFPGEKLAEPIIFVDKNYPLEVIKKAILEINIPAQSLVIVARNRKELETLKKILPLGSHITSLEYLEDWIQIEGLLVISAESLSRAISLAESDDSSRIRDMLEEYRKERIKSFEGHSKTA